jgi:hypothetical protein
MLCVLIRNHHKKNRVFTSARLCTVESTQDVIVYVDNMTPVFENTNVGGYSAATHAAIS